jgi:hypothetical protein
MVQYSGGTLPKDVSMAAGTIGLRFADIVEYNVSADEVRILTKTGQLHAFDIVKLNPEVAPKAPAKRKAKPRSKAVAARSAPGSGGEL